MKKAVPRWGRPSYLLWKFSERLQEFHQSFLVVVAEVQLPGRVVVLDHVVQRGKATVVVEAALGMGEQAAQRSGAVLRLTWRALGLEVIYADLGRGVQVPSRFSEQRRHVAGGALRLALEDRLAALGGG